MINSVLSALEVGRRTYRIGETKLVSELYFDNLSISPDKREVTRNNRKIKLTFTEFEIFFAGSKSRQSVQQRTDL